MPTVVALVEDSIAYLRMGTAILSKAGYQVVTAPDGYEALALCFDKHPDLVLMDWDMPRLTGVRAGALLKESAQFRTTPLVYVTSRKSPFDMARMRMCGADAVITKPFNNQVLLETINNLIGGPGQ
jgi:DNA-binding response OmpR family regulator